MSSLPSRILRMLHVPALCPAQNTAKVAVSEQNSKILRTLHAPAICPDKYIQRVVVNCVLLLKIRVRTCVLKQFCPAYNNLQKESLLRFWVVCTSMYSKQVGALR